MLDKIIFIIGHGRSGTTLLNKILSAHPKIFFVSREFNDLAFFYFNRNLYLKKDIIYYNEMAKDILKHPLINLQIQNINSNNFRELINKIFDFIRKKERKDIIGLKISDMIHANVSMIKSVFPDAYCIHIIRDPRDVFLSIKRIAFGTKSPFYVAKSWKEIVGKISTLKNSIKHYHEIFYEKLITSPKEEIKKLCDFIGIEFSHDMLYFHKKVKESLPPQHKLLKNGFIKNNFNKWKKTLTNKELKLIYAGTGTKIYEMGYSDKPIIEKISFLNRLWEYSIDKLYFYFKTPQRLLLYPWQMYPTKIRLKRIIWKLI